MSRVLPVSDRQSCNHAYIWLILGFICYALPWSVFAAEATTLLRIQGSNTIGAKLGPALVSGLFESQGMSNVRIAKGAENEQSVLAEDKLGRTLQVNVAAHGSGTGFLALQARFKDAGIDYELRGMEKPSDHAPIWLELN